MRKTTSKQPITSLICQICRKMTAQKRIYRIQMRNLTMRKIIKALWNWSRSKYPRSKTPGCATLWTWLRLSRKLRIPKNEFSSEENTGAWSLSKCPPRTQCTVNPNLLSTQTPSPPQPIKTHPAFLTWAAPSFLQVAKTSLTSSRAYNLRQPKRPSKRAISHQSTKETQPKLMVTRPSNNLTFRDWKMGSVIVKEQHWEEESTRKNQAKTPWEIDNKVTQKR